MFVEAAEPLQVLYVEDHPVNAMLMQALFERRPNLRLTVATDGREALTVAASIRPSLLLLDLRLPDCNGAELLPVLRRRFGWADVPAVAVTAEADFQAAGTDFDEVWHKPMDLAMVLQRLDHWLGAPQVIGPRGLDAFSHDGSRAIHGGAQLPQ